VKAALLALLSLSTASAARKVVALDPGHGGKDLGVVRHKILEKNLSLSMARAMDRLAPEGFSGALTRDDDEYVLLSDRVEAGARAGAAAFLSFHVDDTRGKARRGVVLYVFGKNRLIPRGLKREKERHLPDPPAAAVADSRRLALAIKKSLLASGFETGELEHGAFAVLKSSAVPSVLVELGNIRDPGAAARVADLKWQEKLAAAIWRGVGAYFAR
jgi:N-acetylmuramoyl-L-alanine amidase